MNDLLWSGNKIPLIGRYGGHIWQGFGLRFLDARVELILSTGLWIARLGSKHKNLSEITAYKCKRTIMQTSFEVQNVYLRILSL
jgi:hypothetical protein